jgi:guanosine-3',5'-bis(diphosphate) 3'-pyrophosphohydrolase
LYLKKIRKKNTHPLFPKEPKNIRVFKGYTETLMIDDEFGIVVQALSYASRMHRDQRRKGSDHSPYINHLIDVIDMLWRVGEVRDPVLLAAAALHDTVEDTGARPEEIESLFGRAVRDLVMEVTDDKALPKAERKRLQVEHAPHLSRPARLLKLADKICNVRDILSQPPLDWSIERRQAYLVWAGQVVEGLRGASQALEAKFDQLISDR